jgi:hypothetical protein
MKKIKAAKKGMVLLLTSMMLFIATSIVAVLATFVIVSRNQKIEFEYTSRTKIALKSAAYDVYEQFLKSVNTISSFSAEETSRTVVSVSSLYTNLNYNVDVKLYRHDYFNSTDYYFEFEINTDYLNTEEREYLRDASLYVKIDYIYSYTTAGYYQNPENYKIEEMRFA